MAMTKEQKLISAFNSKLADLQDAAGDLPMRISMVQDMHDSNVAEALAEIIDAAQDLQQIIRNGFCMHVPK